MSASAKRVAVRMLIMGESLSVIKAELGVTKKQLRKLSAKIGLA